MLPAESASVCDGNEATKVRSDSLTSLTTPRTRSEVEKRRKEEQVSKQPNKQTIKPNLRRPCQCLNTSVPPDLSLLLPDHQLAQHVAHTEDVLETDLHTKCLQGQLEGVHFIRVPSARSEHINSPSLFISEKWMTTFLYIWR